ncbi:hypothetical protein QCA50_019951 [Cerrena zonata]|uniref:Uncharacterized protein n=1 Tax=Cerrena zonata TaxID=2478898 RepID=A0AAW0F9S3_9APHY
MEREIRPLGSVYDFSPNGWPYLVVDLKFKDLLNPLVYADMVKIQTGLRHTFCLQELDAIKAISSSSSPPHNHLSPLWYSTPTPPLTTTSVSPETSSASLSYSTSIYPDRPCSPGVHTPGKSILRNPPLSSSAYRQPSLPRIPTDRDLIEEHREYPDCDIPRHDVYSMGFHTHFGSPVPSSYYPSTPARFSSSSEHEYLATSYSSSSSSSSHSPSPSPASSSSRYPTQPECQYGVSYIRQDPRPTQPEYKGCTREELSRS